MLDDFDGKLESTHEHITIYPIMLVLKPHWPSAQLNTMTYRIYFPIAWSLLRY